MSVTPTTSTNTQVAVGGTAVNAIPTGPNGGIITNPLTAADQGIATAEPLYINPVGTAATTANGSSFALQPGQSWLVIPNQTTSTSVNAATSGHRFSAIYW